jgi:hypothetical protein
VQHRLLTHSCGRSLHAHDYAARVIPLDSYRSNLVGYHTDPQGISGGFLRLPNSSIAAFEVPGATVFSRRASTRLERIAGYYQANRNSRIQQSMGKITSF